MKRILAIALTLCLLLMATPAFALELLSAGDTYPLSTDKTITWYDQGSIHPHEKFSDWTESPFHTGLNAILGVDIQWMFPTTGSSGGTFIVVSAHAAKNCRATPPFCRFSSVIV